MLAYYGKLINMKALLIGRWNNKNYLNLVYVIPVYKKFNVSNKEYFMRTDGVITRIIGLKLGEIKL